MITAAQAFELVPGDAIFQHCGWRDNKVTSVAEWQVDAVHSNSIDIVRISGSAIHSRVNRSEFPLVYWSLEGLQA